MYKYINPPPPLTNLIEFSALHSNDIITHSCVMNWKTHVKQFDILFCSIALPSVYIYLFTYVGMHIHIYISNTSGARLLVKLK